MKIKTRSEIAISEAIYEISGKILEKKDIIEIAKSFHSAKLDRFEFHCKRLKIANNTIEILKLIDSITFHFGMVNWDESEFEKFFTEVTKDEALGIMIEDKELFIFNKDDESDRLVESPEEFKLNNENEIYCIEKS